MSVDAADASAVDVALATLKAGAASPNSSIQGACATLANLAAKKPVAAVIEQKGAMIPILDNLARLTGKHPQAVAGCFAALVNLAGARPTFKNALVQGTDAIAAIKLALLAHLEDETCQLYGMWALANLSLNDLEGSKKVLEDDGLESVVKIMKANASKPQTLRLGVALLGQFARGDPAVLAQIGALDGVELITAGLRAHPSDAKLATTCAQALQNLAFGGAVNDKIRTAKSAEAVLAAMRACEKDATVVQAGLGMLTNILIVENLRAEDSAIIVQAIGAHLRVPEVQQAGCMILGCAVELVYDGGKGSAALVPYVETLAAKGAIVAVVNAVNEHLASPEVVRAGCSALQNLSIAGLNFEAVHKAGGLKAIIAALGKHMSNPSVQNAAFAVLNNCLRSAEAISEAVAAGAVPTIVKVVTSNIANPDLVRRGIALLGQLGLASDEIRSTINSDGGIKAAVAAIKAHEHGPAVLEAAIGALRNFTFSGANTEECRDAHAIPAVLEAMRRFPKSAPIQHAGCGFIVNMALDDEESRAHLARNGAADIISLALGSFPEHAGIQRSGGVALATINQTLDLLKAQAEAKAAREKEEAAAASAAASAASAAEAASAAAQAALKAGEAGHDAAAESKAKLARTTRAGRVQELIDLYESGDLFIWDAPKKLISLK